MLIIAIVLLIWQLIQKKTIQSFILLSFQTCIPYFLLRNMKDYIILVTKHFPLPMTFIVFLPIQWDIQFCPVNGNWNLLVTSIPQNLLFCWRMSRMMWGCVNYPFKCFTPMSSVIWTQPKTMSVIMREKCILCLRNSWSEGPISCCPRPEASSGSSRSHGGTAPTIQHNLLSIFWEYLQRIKPTQTKLLLLTSMNISTAGRVLQIGEASQNDPWPSLLIQSIIVAYV